MLIAPAFSPVDFYVNVGTQIPRPAISRLS